MRDNGRPDSGYDRHNFRALLRLGSSQEANDGRNKVGRDCLIRRQPRESGEPDRPIAIRQGSDGNGSR